MLYTNKAIIVEGKYDKIKLSSVVDAVIIQTDGFDIFNNEDKRRLISFWAAHGGIIILTDSDEAGFKIRSYIKSFVPGEFIKNAYIPDVFGKERRKDKPSKEGKLGVEGIDTERLTKALLDTGAFWDSPKENKSPVTMLDLYELGLFGGKNSREKRAELLKTLNLPERLSAKALTDTVNAFMSRDEFLKLAECNTNKE